MKKEKIYTERTVLPPYENLGQDENLEPVLDGGKELTLDLWEQKKKYLLSIWEKIIGRPSFSGFEKSVEKIDSFSHPDYEGTVFRQATGPSSKQLLLLMEPAGAPEGKKPGAIIPFYHPDLMAGYRIKERKPIQERKNVQFGLHLVRQGYIVVCTEAFPFNTVPEPPDSSGFAWWQAAADRILKDNPGWTGIGKLVWDTKLATDFLLEKNNVDNQKIVAMGHSLGGKMAFCAGALDDRIKSIIGSDFGMGWKFTNWDADWYFGQQLNREDFKIGLHHLLALHAPDSFLLIGGLTDRPASWQYINEARKIYRLYGKESSLGFFDHASGHQPTEESLKIAYGWLAEQFGLPEPGHEVMS